MLSAPHLSVADFLNACKAIAGEQYVLSTAEDKQVFESEWRGRMRGDALAVVLPSDTAQVAAIVKLCRKANIAIVPQGGNTGLVLGSIPTAPQTAIILSTRRLNRIRAVDADSNTMIAEAGCTLAAVQQAATDVARLFPLSLASEGTCTIGGNLSTNAGGTAVLRYGNTRDLCLGLEVVTADGEVISQLHGLRKDNTGYDLKQWFIGAEGTLGIITAAVLKLHPQPRTRCTALLAVSSPENALQILRLAGTCFGPALTTFELISGVCTELVLQHIPGTRQVFPQQHPYQILLEVSDFHPASHTLALWEDFEQELMQADLILDGALAGSVAQANDFWKLRESISEAQAKAGRNLKHDISVPVGRIPAFIAETGALLAAACPGAQVVCFGHMGDGNLHYNVNTQPVNHQVNPEALSDTAVSRLIHDQVHRFGGSFSAEHGVGAMKRDDMLRYKSETELSMMRVVKQALDPAGIMNPGKIL